MLKNKNQISDYDIKAKLLRENGWSDLWHIDNWIAPELMAKYPKCDIDRAGCSTSVAWNSLKISDEELKVYKSNEPIKLTFLQKLIGAFKNRIQ